MSAPTTFNEYDHPRAGSGRFTEAVHADADDVTLTPAAAVDDGWPTLKRQHKVIGRELMLAHRTLNAVNVRQRIHIGEGDAVRAEMAEYSDTIALRLSRPDITPDAISKEDLHVIDLMSFAAEANDDEFEAIASNAATALSSLMVSRPDEHSYTNALPPLFVCSQEGMWNTALEGMAKAHAKMTGHEVNQAR